MWHCNQICAVALLALGLGILLGCICGSTVVCVLLGLGSFCLGCLMLRRK